MLREVDVKTTLCSDAKEYLRELIQRLDELDELNYFGSEGWHRMLMEEDS